MLTKFTKILFTRVLFRSSLHTYLSIFSTIIIDSLQTNKVTTLLFYGYCCPCGCHVAFFDSYTCHHSKKPHHLPSRPRSSILGSSYFFNLRDAENKKRRQRGLPSFFPRSSHRLHGMKWDSPPTLSFPPHHFELCKPCLCTLRSRLYSVLWWTSMSPTSAQPFALATLLT